MNTGLRWKVGIVAVVAATACVATPAAAEPPTDTRTVQIRSTFTEPPSTVDGLHCRGLAASAPACGAVEKTTTTFSGPLAGVADAEVVGALHTDGKYHFDGTWTFAEATVDGCGTAPLILEMFDGTVAPSTEHPGMLDGVTQWRVRDNAWTAGGGSATFSVAVADALAEKWNDGELTGSITCTTPAKPRPKTEIRTITVRAEYTEPASSVDGVECRGLGGAPPSPDCRGRVVGPASFTGTITGDAYYALTGPTPEGHHYEGHNHFEDAVVEGCGRGSFDLVDHKGALLVEQYDPVTNTMPGFNTWSVANGRGGLAGLISGEGENRWTIYWSESGTERWGRGVFTGTITCEVPKHGDEKQDRGADVLRAAFAPATAGAVQAGLPATGSSPVGGAAGAAALAISLLARRRGRRARRGS